MRSSEKGYSSISVKNPMLTALSMLSLTSFNMCMNTVPNNTPPPKHNTVPAINYSMYYVYCVMNLNDTDE